jgi:GT2 family glycosyltransferase
MNDTDGTTDLRIPIVVINWNGFDDTVECLESVLSLEYHSFEVHLIDNASANDEGIRLEKKYRNNDEIHIHRLDQNLGFTKAHLWLLHQLPLDNYQFIALLNNDTVVEPDWLLKLVEAAEQKEAHVVSSKLIYFYDRTIMDNAGHQMLNTGEIIPIGHSKPISQFDKSFENMGSCAAATLYSIEMIRKIGFFDAHFSTGYEDAEYGVRAFVAGYKCLYEPKAIAYHKVGRSIRKVFNIKYALMIQGSILYSYFKLMPRGVILISLPFMIFKNLIMILINLLFWRPRYQKILFASWWQLVNNLGPVFKKRQAFFQDCTPRSSWEILGRQTFFLGYDFKRFVNIFLKGSNSALDSYGNET